MKTIDSTCVGCGAAYPAEALDFAYRTRDDRQASGFDGTSFYWTGRNGRDLPTEAFYVVTRPVFGYTGDRCAPCAEAYLGRDEKRRELCSDVAPAWFDPSYAGEAW